MMRAGDFGLRRNAWPHGPRLRGLPPTQSCYVVILGLALRHLCSRTLLSILAFWALGNISPFLTDAAILASQTVTLALNSLVLGHTLELGN